MPPSAPAAPECLVPVLRYRDVAAAAQWLSAAFGFEIKTLVHPSDGDAAGGSAIYAELVHGRGAIMLVPVGQSDLDAHMRQPDELGGVETQTCYVTVTDAAAHLERAVLNGAQVVLPLSGDQTGQRGYSCRDLEGHIWNFGTYTPAQGVTAKPETDPAIIAAQQAAMRGRRGRALPVLTLGLVGLAAWTWMMPGNPLATTAVHLLEKTSVLPLSDQSTRQELARVQSELKAEQRQAQEAIGKLRQEAAEARDAVKAAELAAQTASKDLAAEYSRRTAAEQGGGDAAPKAATSDAELTAAKENLARLESELQKERSARGQSVLAAEAVRAELDREIKKREHLEQIVVELDRKADDRLQGASNSVQSNGPPASAAVSAAGSVPAPPPETGSVGPHDAAAGGVPEQTGPKASPDQKSETEKNKVVSAKRAKPQNQPKTQASKGTGSAKKEDKLWPYNAW